MNTDSIRAYIDSTWQTSIVPELIEYIRIPNKSPAFDKEWREHGYIDQVVMRFEAWAARQPIKGMKVEVQRVEDRTPLILIDIPGASDDVVLLYGHLDKQPEMTGWRDGLGPWTPLLEGDRLYGRGAADDGYSMFACLAAIGALETASIPHARCVIIIEACEESGSFDLPHHIERLGDRLGTPSFVIGLDSGCGNYDRLWCTTSLRGLAGGTLKVEVLTEGIHSGASGIVPDSFRVARMLLNRIEDERSGRILVPAYHVPIPEARIAEARTAAIILQESLREEFPFVAGARPAADDAAELILNRDWRPALSIIGQDGIPQIGSAGNVLRPMTALKLSLRIPPGCDAKKANASMKEILEKDPPYGARVSFKGDWAAAGWNAPELAPWLGKALEAASNRWFGKGPAYMGLGGTIPFMSMLGEKFPEAQFLITGVLGPYSNAHGPNEFLHVPYARRLTCCVAEVIAQHYRRQAST